MTLRLGCMNYKYLRYSSIVVSKNFKLQVVLRKVEGRSFRPGEVCMDSGLASLKVLRDEYRTSLTQVQPQPDTVHHREARRIGIGNLKRNLGLGVHHHIMVQRYLECTCTCAAARENLKY